MGYLKLKDVPWAVSQSHLQEFVLEMYTRMAPVVLGNSSFIEYWSRMHDPEFGSQHPIKLSLVMCTCNPSTRWNQEAQKFKAVLSYKVVLHHKTSSDQPRICETLSHINKQMNNNQRKERLIRGLERWLHATKPNDLHRWKERMDCSCKVSTDLHINTKKINLGDCRGGSVVKSTFWFSRGQGSPSSTQTAQLSVILAQKFKGSIVS